MINETSLKGVLVSLAEYSKMQQVMISSMLNELAALRETVRALDPAFGEVLEAKREKFQEDTRPEVVESIQMLNRLIAQINAGGVC